MGLESPVTYVGGKHAWRDWLVSLFAPHETYVEAFGGGGSVLLAKPPSRIEIYNDLDGNLVNLFAVLRDEPDAFAKMWGYTVNNREEFERFLKEDWTKLPPLQRAYRYLYVNRASFSGHMRRPSWTVKNTNQLAQWVTQAQTWTKELHDRLVDVYVEHGDFRDVIPHYDKRKSDGGTLFFLDPPYLVKDPAYVHWFELQDHLDLLECVKRIKGKWIMTINDCPEYRQWYADYHIMEKSKNYSLAKEDCGRHEFGELIISNYPLPEQKQARLF